MRLPGTSPSLNDVKEFWNSRPCNLRHSNAPVGTRQYFDEVEKRKYFVEPHIPSFASFNEWKHRRVLEIGCGIGTDAINFVRGGADYTGIELSAESLALAKKRFQIYGLSGRLLEGNAETVDSLFKGETFDLIYSFGVLHHTPKIEAALNAIQALMHKDSIFKMMVYADKSWKGAMIASGLDQPEAQHGCPIANTYTDVEVINLLNQNGLQAIELKQDHIFPYIVDEYVQYNYVMEPWFQVMPQKTFQALEKALGWHLLVTSKKL